MNLSLCAEGQEDRIIILPPKIMRQPKVLLFVEG